MAKRHRRLHHRRKRYGDGPSSGMTFGKVVLAVMAGSLAYDWATAILPISPSQPALGPSPYQGLRYLRG